jgi:hypothetical protein
MRTTLIYTNLRELILFWLRRERDSNPRCKSLHNRLAIYYFKPLSHRSNFIILFILKMSRILNKFCGEKNS